MAAQRQHRREATAALVSELRALQDLLQVKLTQRGELKKALEALLETLAAPASPVVRSPALEPIPAAAPFAPSRALVVMTLNLQYYSSYPDDRMAAAHRLREATGGPNPPDVICVQEGVKDVDVLSAAGFELCVCAGREHLAQSVSDMVYGDAGTLRTCKEALHSALLCNQIYIRRGSGWEVEARGAERVSSDMWLAGGGGRAQGPLAMRSMAWARLRCTGTTGPAVVVMCTHLTGGRFEDQYFAQQLAQERRRQVERCARFFAEQRPRRSDDDVGILVGDFNATREYTMEGPMHGYFRAAIAQSEGVRSDARAAGMESEADLEENFKAYMTSPFMELDRLGWTFAYGKEVGITSGFGHLIDHMAASRPLQVASAEVIYLTNQKVGQTKPDTDLPLTDHNAVKAVFLIQ